MQVVPGSHRLPAFKRRTTQHGAPLPSSFQWPGPLEAPPPSSPALARTAVSKSPRTTAAAPAPATDLRGWATSDYLPGDVVAHPRKSEPCTPLAPTITFCPEAFHLEATRTLLPALKKQQKALQDLVPTHMTLGLMLPLLIPLSPTRLLVLLPRYPMKMLQQRKQPQTRFGCPSTLVGAFAPRTDRIGVRRHRRCSLRQ